MRLWDRDGEPSAWSEPAKWTVGLLDPADWQAQWIDGRDPRFLDAAQPGALRRATYGPPDGTSAADVTAAVQTLLASGRTDLTADNTTLGGDPSPGVAKRLHLEYEKAGAAFTFDIPEGGPLRLGGSGTGETNESPRILRKSFSLDDDVIGATLYVTALGLYECRLNGERVGDAVLAPDWTDLRPARALPGLRREPPRAAGRQRALRTRGRRLV